MNAIIIAAGSGKRISNKIRNTPKALIEINNKTIIQYQIDALKKMNIDKIIVITGPNYEKHDILGSLIEARDYIKNDVLVLYSDIIFEPKIIGDVLDSKSNISIAVDMNWEEKYQNRTEHPTTEAENVLLDERKNIFQIRKNIQGESNRIGEFLGILKFSAEGAKIFVEKYDELMRKNIGEFHEASTIFKAYITDMLQELIDSKINIEPVFISGKWCEIDTMQDLKIAEKIF